MECEFFVGKICSVNIASETHIINVDMIGCKIMANGRIE
jgi:hypothetical protein